MQKKKKKMKKKQLTRKKKYTKCVKENDKTEKKARIKKDHEQYLAPRTQRCYKDSFQVCLF